MDRRSFLSSMIMGVASTSFIGWKFKTPKKEKPNIVFILADDLGWADLGCYGNTYHETPNIDRLAHQGVKFTQAYAAAPVCSPYRAALITGQHPARVGITDFLRWKSDPLPTDHITLAEMLKRAGYKTALIGKWHLTGFKDKGAKEEIPPTEHGFDRAILWERKKLSGLGGKYHGWFNDKNEYITDRLGEEAIKLIEEWKDQPFFLYLSHYAVHTWLGGKGYLINKYKFKKRTGRYKTHPYRDKKEVWKEQYVTPSLAAVLDSLDQSVGLVLKKLDQLGLSDNTIVVFTSDNGGEEFVTSNYPLRAGKSTLYEGGIRVPLVVRWPGKIPENTVSDIPTCNFDFYPTFLDAIGIKPDPRQKLDGISILPVFKNPKFKLNRETFYWHYPLEKPHFLGGRSSGAIRHGDWKLIEYFDTGDIELYNLANDIGEKENLADKNKDKRDELYKMLVEWRQKNNITIDPKCMNYDPEKVE